MKLQKGDGARNDQELLKENEPLKAKVEQLNKQVDHFRERLEQTGHQLQCSKNENTKLKTEVAAVKDALAKTQSWARSTIANLNKRHSEDREVLHNAKRQLLVWCDQQDNVSMQLRNIAQMD